MSHATLRGEFNDNMLRLILVLIVVGLLAVGGLAVALNHYYGWKGLVAFPFILIVLVWLGKFIIGKLLKGFVFALFGMKSGVLREATMTVHSITPVAKPAEQPIELDDDDAPDDAESEAGEDNAGSEPAEPEDVRHYYEVDMTITPRPGSGERVWEPAELILTSRPTKSLSEMEEDDCDVGHTHDCLIWNGNAFATDDIGKYPGEQRLLLTLAVMPGTSQAWVQYYDVPLGEVALPPWEQRG